jgi:hypothetical protein
LTDNFQYNAKSVDTENIPRWHMITATTAPQSIWGQTHTNVTDKKNNVSFEGIDIHCH